MKCQKCDSDRVIGIMAKCSDGYSVSLLGKDYPSPLAEGMFDGEYVEPKICLDCGQCQGTFPVELVGEPEEFYPPPDTYDSAMEFFTACKEHSCDKKRLISCDNPMTMVMGFTCVYCNSFFGLRLSTFRKTGSELPKEIQLELETGEGRVRLAKVLSE